MSIDWPKLAEAFPPDEVKHRPGAARYAHKSSCEGARCRETQDPEKHIQFSYVDARAVAERLDTVLTPARWQFFATAQGDIVHGRLAIEVDGNWIVREDHGYPNSERDEEPVKAATSDALKRCAVLFGVGRHLYDDNSSGQKNGSSNGRGVTGSTASAARPSLPPAAGSASRDDFWERGEEAKPEPFAPIGAADPNGWAGKRAGDPCPECGEPLKGRDEDVYHPTGLEQPKYHRPPKERAR